MNLAELDDAALVVLAVRDVLKACSIVPALLLVSDLMTPLSGRPVFDRGLKELNIKI